MKETRRDGPEKSLLQLRAQAKCEKRGRRAGKSMREGAVYETGVKAGAVPPAWPSH